MSRRVHLPPEWLDPAAVCSFCGDKGWNGEWHGRDLVRCCTICAIRVLPALMADSIFHESTPVPMVRSRLRDAIGRFWEAMYLNAMRPRATVARVVTGVEDEADGPG